MVDSPPHSKAAVRALRILHIEDSTPDHVLARKAVQRGGLDCDWLHIDTLEALHAELDAAPGFDLVLADYRLPGFTALDAWQAVQQHAAPPPFVLLSGAIGEAAAVDAMRLGLADYLLKDDMARLPHVIERAIEVHEARRARERAVAELAVSERRLADLTEHLQRSIENERAAIAREIHDDIGGALTAVKFDLSWIARHAVPGSAASEHAAAALEMLQHALGASQRIMMDLRPPVLDQGLAAAVQWLAEGFERRTGVPVRISTGRALPPLAPEVQLAAYRTAQEALTNASKYAQARQVRIELSADEGVLTLEVADDGVGMEPVAQHKRKAFGLKGLQERARTVGGWLDVSSQPGHGTSVIISVPLAWPDSAGEPS